jgi:hypothetical protein
MASQGEAEIEKKLVSTARGDMAGRMHEIGRQASETTN